MSATRPRLYLANAHFVTPHLAIGGDLDADDDLAGEQLLELIQNGLTHILDVRVEASDETFVTRIAPWIEYRHLGIDDAGQTIPFDWFGAVTEFALDALSDPDAVVLAHCHMGINRGPSAGFAILLAQGWDPIAALDAIRRVRAIAITAYAEDALRWHHRRGNPRELKRDLGRLATWRTRNRLDLASVARATRQGGRTA